MSAAMLGRNITPSLMTEYRGKRHYLQSHRKTSLFGSENEQQNVDSGVYKTSNNHNSNSSATIHPRSPSNAFSPQDEEVQSSKSVVRNGTPYKDNEHTPFGAQTNANFPSGLANGEPYRMSAEDEFHADRNKSLEESGDRVKTFHSNRVISTSDFEQNTKHKTQNQQAGIIEEKEMNGLIKAAKERAERRELNRQIRSSGEEGILAHTVQTPEQQTQKRAALQAPWYTDPEDGIGNSQVRGTTLAKRSSSTPRPTLPRSTSEMDYQRYSAQQLKNLRTPTRKYGNNDSVPWYPENRGSRFSRSRDEETYQTSSSKIGESFMRIFNLDNQNFQDGKETSEQDNPGTPNGKLSSLRNTPYAQHY